MDISLLLDGAGIGLATVVVVWILRKLAKRLKGDKWGTRALALVVCAGWVLFVEWVPDQQMTAEEFWLVFWLAVPHSQFTYSWIIKTLDKMA